MLGPAVRPLTASGHSRGLQAAFSCASPYLVANSPRASHRQGKHSRTTSTPCTPNSRPRSSPLPPLGARFSSNSATPSRSRTISSKDALASIASDQGPIPTPKQLMAHLDAYVIGQATAKRTLCVAVHNHLLRCRIEDAQKWEEQRKGEISEEEGTDNVPGSASKEVKRQIPFANRGLPTGASGYRTRPRKSRSLHPDGPPEHETGPGFRHEEDILTDWAGQAKGRRYVDGYPQDDAGDGRPEAHASGSSQSFFNSNLSESDMRAQRQLEWTRTPADSASPSASRANSSTSGSSHARNRGLARTTSSVGIVSSADDKPRLPRPNVLLLGPSGSGKTLLLSTLARALQLPFVHVDATPLTQAGYVGEDAENIVARLLSAAGGDVQAAQRGIVVLDEVVTVEGREVDQSRRAAATAGAAASVRGSDLYDLAEVEDLTAYGLIPEFIGRVPVMAALSALSEEELLRVMTEPRHSLTQEYETLFRAYGVELRFTSLALQVFASQATNGTSGA
ncbi:atp-dependent clp atp-binding subunit [Ceraceosorus bombacis]|uniref:Atp-dependent clp atp-binding subunit n=1 Tax=Ceraceosorus bombacis TaxID=401625 RepID=A0A0P1BL70_9BASI|nr:atp-dependent clp atp-binding subunit [Ceraceosorus bombacis]